MEHAIPWTGNQVDQGCMQIYDFLRVFRKWSEGSGGCNRPDMIQKLMLTMDGILLACKFRLMGDCDN
jgi:hypothetical protein